jgi:cytochrome c553
MASAHAAGAAADGPKVDTAAGSNKYAQICVACHAADGNSSTPANPKLAGQHPEYLNKQLKEYKSGRRANAIMAGMVAALNEQDMLNISHWLAEQTPKDGYASNPDSVRLGERIYRGGIADRNIPACAGCHSPNGAGIPSQYPRLAGQHAAYTAAQLTAFRDGVRANNAAMTLVAAKLNDKEIAAVSDYIAGLR